MPWARSRQASLRSSQTWSLTAIAFLNTAVSRKKLSPEKTVSGCAYTRQLSCFEVSAIQLCTVPSNCPITVIQLYFKPESAIIRCAP